MEKVLEVVAASAVKTRNDVLLKRSVPIPRYASLCCHSSLVLSVG